MRPQHRLRLLFWTLRYLTPGQVWWRGRRMMRRRWWRLRDRQAPLPTHWHLARPCSLYSGLSAVTEPGPWAAEVAVAVEQAAAVSRQRFSFLNHEVCFPTQPGWHDTHLSQLWRYHLHYFDYVRDLLIWSATGHQAEAYQSFCKLSASWIAENRKMQGDGWHPYTISLRLVNWLHAVSAFESCLQADTDFHHYLLSSLYGQAQVLFADLERDVRGNHLLENIRALIWAGVAFEGAEPERWLQRALKLFEQELSEQILADGGHFERSPGYHLVILKDCLEIALWLRFNRALSLRWLDDALRRMLDYLAAILPSDGQVPLLKDTAWDAAPVPQDLLAVGAFYFKDTCYKRSATFGLYPLLLFGLPGWETYQHLAINQTTQTAIALKSSNHYVLRDDTCGDYLILDIGKPCPDYLPAHAHADLLSYELLLDHLRVVVDSGVYEYTPGLWRDYFRSTRAHNTIEIAAQNQSEVWASFRVARRARPGPVVWQQHEAHILVQGEHDGYQRLPTPVTHRRTMVWGKPHFWLCVDELQGTGAIPAVNYIHLHPRLTLVPIDAWLWRIDGHATPLWIAAFNVQDHAIIRGQLEPVRQGWYSERFGCLSANSVLALTLPAALPACSGYVISRSRHVQVDMIGTAAGNQINVNYDQRSYRLHLTGSHPTFL